jgi:hypothetical protein
MNNNDRVNMSYMANKDSFDVYEIEVFEITEG